MRSENGLTEQPSDESHTLVLHGTWSEGAFFIWAESAEITAPPRGRRSRVPPHPHAASPERLREALETQAPSGAWADAPATARVALLPSNTRGPLLPPWLAPVPDLEEESEPHLAPWKIPGLALDTLTALDLLATLPLRQTEDRRWGADLRYWGLIAKMGLEFLAHHQVLPGVAESDGRYRAVWLLLLDNPEDRARLKVLAQAMPPVCRALFPENQVPKADQSPAPHVLEVFAVNVPLFPSSQGDLKTDCSCPDWANPCKHIAAVYYLLGERFDEDPFLLFQLRGRDKDAVIAALRERRIQGAEPVGEPAYVPETIEAVEVAALTQTLEDYWKIGPEAESLTFKIGEPQVEMALLKRLGAPEFEGLDARTFWAQMKDVYRTVSRRALEVAFADAG